MIDAQGRARCAVRDLLEEVEAICARHHISQDEFFSARRYKPLPAARADFCVSLRSRGFATPEIGRLINRDTSTVSLILKARS